MHQDYWNYDDIKRKSRELKKLEIKIRSGNIDFKKDGKNSLRKFDNTELIWNKFFDLKKEATKNVRYSIIDLSKMTKGQYKDAIAEYFY